MVRLYLLILPLGMVADLGLVTPVVTAVIALLFLGLDAIGRAVVSCVCQVAHRTRPPGIGRYR